MKTRAIFMLTLFTAASLPLALAAQQTQTQLDEVRVSGGTGGGGTAPAGTSPTTTVTAADIEKKQAGSLGDVLRDAPGVLTAGRGDVLSAMPNIRGFGGGPHMAADPATQVALDGVSTSGGRNYQAATDMLIDPSILRSARVLAGPLASLAYGSGISGGTVAMETINGADLTGDQVGFKFRQLLSASSNGRGWATSSTIGWQPSSNVDFLFNYSRRARDEQKDGNGVLNRRKAFNVPSYLLKARYRINDENTLTLSYNRSSSAQRDVPLFQASGSGAVGNADIDRIGWIFSATWNYKPTGNDLIDIELRYSRSDQTMDKVGTTPALPNNALYDGRTETVTDRLTLKNTARFSTGAIAHELQAGLDFSKLSQSSDVATQPASGNYNRAALFAINNMDFGSDLRASAGIRIERQTIRGITAPPANAVVGPFSTTARTAGVGLEKGFGNITAFGSFTYGEMLANADVFHQVAPVRFGVGFYGETVQKSRNWELGLRYQGNDVFQSGDRLTAGITAFNTDVWNAMYGPNTGGLAAGTGYKMRGIDLSLRYDAANGFYGRGNLSYANHSQQAGVNVNPALNLAWSDYLYNPGARATVTLGKRWENGWDVSWTLQAARSNTIGATTHPGWGVNDLNVAYTPQSGVFAGATINFGVENIFDKTYRNQPLSSLNEPGRNFKLSISKTF